MRTIVLTAIVVLGATACSTNTPAINIEQLSHVVHNLLDEPEGDVLRAHGDPHFVYEEPSDPDTSYLGYVLDPSCSVTYLIQGGSVSIVATLGPGCSESPRERLQADQAIKYVNGKHLGEILLTMFGTPDNSNLDPNGSGVLSYELGAEAQIRRNRIGRSPQRWPSEEQIARQREEERRDRERKQPCTVDIAFANGVVIGAWAKGGQLACSAKRF